MSNHKSVFTKEQEITVDFLTSKFVHQSQVLNSLGQESDDVMSQKATTDALIDRVTGLEINGNYLRFNKKNAAGAQNSTDITVPYATTAAKLSSANVITDQTISSLISGKTYINCTLSGLSTITSGTYYFYNCNGTIPLSGTYAKIYITNSPALSVTGITASNWKNVWIDGKAKYYNGNSCVIRDSDGTQVCSDLYVGKYGDMDYSMDIYFPASFVSSTISIVATSYTSDAPAWKQYNYFVSTGSYTASKFTLYVRSIAGQICNRVNYLAIGRWKV